MKKFYLLFLCGVSALAANAQLTLSGTSYTQNFDGIGSGLPTGWSVYSGAGANYIGNITSLNTSTTMYPSVLRPDTSCIAGVVVGGFKNYPSANVSSAGDDYCAGLLNYTNRALGVRQVSPTNASHPNLDSGAAFVLQLANTTDAKNFNLSFKLQSMDSSSSRTVTWLVDYGIGSTPSTFIPATTTTGTWTTGGHTFSNNTVTVDFGTALDHSTSPVYIRIVTLVYSSGSGNRPSTGIDDYALTWTSTVGVNEVANNSTMDFTTLGEASSNAITLAYNAHSEETFQLCITDLSGRVVYSTGVDAQTGTHAINVNGANLAPGMYIATLANATSKNVTKVMVH